MLTTWQVLSAPQMFNHKVNLCQNMYLEDCNLLDLSLQELATILCPKNGFILSCAMRHARRYDTKECVFDLSIFVHSFSREWE